MSTSVPDGWKSVRLGDLIALEYGRSLSAPSRRPGNVPVYGSNGIVGYHSAAFVQHRGIVVGRKGTAGSVTVTEGPFWPIDTTYFVVPKLEIDLDWLAAKLRHLRLDRLNEATGVPGLNRDKAYQLPVLIPPLAEQRAIADTLRSVDVTTDLEQATVSQLQTLYAATVRAFLFSGADAVEKTLIEDWTTGRIRGLDMLPRGWTVVRLVDVARLESGHTPSRKISSYWDEGDIDWISLHDTKNLEQREISETTLKITADGLANSSARLLPTGTVCLSRTATIGKCVIMSKPMATSQDFANFICSERINNRYLLHLFRWMAPVWSQLASGSTHKTIYMPTFESLQIVLPPIEAQLDIADTLDEISRFAEFSAESRLRKQSVKSAVANDLLTGHVRVQKAPMARVVQPAFKRAVFAAEVVHQLHEDVRFGSVKHEKIVHLCELHLDLQADLDRHAYKQAAGPYDPKARRSVEAIFRQQKWFNATKPNGKAVVYQPLENCGGHGSYYARYFGAKKNEVQSIIDLMKSMNTEQCEIVATLYAVWNDFLIDGQQTTDDAIVAGVLKWHPKKQDITLDRWFAALPWMRKHGLVPKGLGEKTRTAPG